MEEIRRSKIHILFSGVTTLFIIFAHSLAEEENNFAKEILKEHNTLRALHQAPPLILDEELSKNAIVEAKRKVNDYLNFTKFTPNPDDSDDRNYNDNTWASVSYAQTKLNAQKICGEWAKQAQNYNWTDNYFSPKTGHFSQMVWKSTEDLGVGSATGRTSKKHYVTVVVVRYSPPGNILDRDTFAENVLPPLSNDKAVDETSARK